MDSDSKLLSSTVAPEKVRIVTISPIENDYIGDTWNVMTNYTVIDRIRNWFVVVHIYIPYMIIFDSITGLRRQ